MLIPSEKIYFIGIVYNLAVFMDIRGKFVSTTFTAIQKAQKRCNVGETMMKVNCEYAESRKMHLTIQENSTEVKVVKGCTHGGILLPLLWCMVLDSSLPANKCWRIPNTRICGWSCDGDSGQRLEHCSRTDAKRFQKN